MWNKNKHLIGKIFLGLLLLKIGARTLKIEGESGYDFIWMPLLIGLALMIGLLIGKSQRFKKD